MQPAVPSSQVSRISRLDRILANEALQIAMAWHLSRSVPRPLNLQTFSSLRSCEFHSILRATVSFNSTHNSFIQFYAQQSTTFHLVILPLTTASGDADSLCWGLTDASLIISARYGASWSPPGPPPLPQADRVRCLNPQARSFRTTVAPKGQRPAERIV